MERLDLILKIAAQVQRAASVSTPSPNVSRRSVAPSSAPKAASAPHFRWLIRDQHLHMQGEPRDEMLSKLDKSTRVALQEHFQSCECSILPCPVNDDSQLAHIEAMQFGDLTPTFQVTAVGSPTPLMASTCAAGGVHHL